MEAYQVFMIKIK